MWDIEGGEGVYTVILSTGQISLSLEMSSASLLSSPAKNSSKSTISLVTGSVAWNMKFELRTQHNIII